MGTLCGRNNACGVVSYPETVTGEAERLVIISDEYGSAANIIVNAVRSRALNSGYEIYNAVAARFYPRL